jgi:hypothetical protein
MALILPNLDDRTFDDLMEEARSLLPVFAPDLTNHNPSEPLITLTELFAYFTEILIYRLNLVTEANRIAFLRLLNGPEWPDPQRPPPSGNELDAEVRRTVLRLRQTDRAVTPADFEFLARAADSQGKIARVHCIPGVDLSIADPAVRLGDAPGHVSLVIVPRDPPDPPDSPNPPDALIRLVEDHLEPRRLLTTRVHVVGPRHVPVSVQITLHLMPDAREAVVAERAVNALTAWFDPIVGHGGAGWPFGRSVHVSEIYRLLDGLEGVDFATRTVDGDQLLDEISTDPLFSDRLRRNEDGELISIALNPDDLVKAQISVTDIHTVIPRS